MECDVVTLRFNRKIGALLTGISALALASLASFAFGAAQPVNPSDAQAIQAAVERGYRLQAEAARSFDTSGFAAAFADDARVPLTDLQQRALARFAPGTNAAGYLSYERAYFAWWQAGDRSFQTVQAARAKGVTPSTDDLNNAVSRRADPYSMPVFTLHSIRIDGDLAYYEADTPASLIRMTLVNTNGTWRVAGEDDVAHP